MDLVTYRTTLGLSQEQAAAQLGIKSAGHLSDIERGARPAGLRLALRIERWSNGKIPASSICADAEGVALAKPKPRAA